MTTRKNPVKKTTIDKINTLFTYRRITDLLNASGLNQDKNFVGQLIDVQFQIYMLDAYLESQWALDKGEIKSLWKPIRASLTAMGYSKKKVDALVEEIVNYEGIERNCRKNRWPTKESMKKFYVTKSCDVRLIRHLIYQAHPALNDLYKEKSWMYYDIITEINDDVADVQEDINSFNGNRFLISILRKGTDKTRKEYMAYLTGITAKAADYFSARMDRGKNKQLASWIVARSRETAKLLETQTNPKMLDKLSSSLLLVEMK
ncbi:MAG: hypothetical protein M3R25_05820 [Bacteroidota bacterium]|nr:hypothetical protein [Bacteroidota bacterium]